MICRGLYSKLLEIRDTKDLLQLYWSSTYKCTGFVDSLSADVISIKKINSEGEEDGIVTIPVSLITHITENSQEISQIKQSLIQKSFNNQFFNQDCEFNDQNNNYQDSY